LVMAALRFLIERYARIHERWKWTQSSGSKISRRREIVCVYMIFSMRLCLFTAPFFTADEKR